MEISELEIKDAFLSKVQIWTDDRGFFREWFKLDEISKATGRDFSVAQANISSSARGVVRGIHYSLAAVGQAKWVTCVSGAIRDVIVDIRPGSPTYGDWVSVDLASNDGKAILIGEGLGHGFVSLVDHSTVAYLVTSPFSPTEEFEINPLDPELGIEWGLPVSELVLSGKDKSAPTLMQRKSTGQLPRG